MFYIIKIIKNIKNANYNLLIDDLNEKEIIFFLFTENKRFYLKYEFSNEKINILEFDNCFKTKSFIFEKIIKIIILSSLHKNNIIKKIISYVDNLKNINNLNFNELNISYFNKTFYHSFDLSFPNGMNISFERVNNNSVFNKTNTFFFDRKHNNLNCYVLNDGFSCSFMPKLLNKLIKRDAFYEKIIQTNKLRMKFLLIKDDTF